MNKKNPANKKPHALQQSAIAFLLFRRRLLAVCLAGLVLNAICAVLPVCTIPVSANYAEASSLPPSRQLNQVGQKGKQKTVAKPATKNTPTKKTTDKKTPMAQFVTMEGTLNASVLRKVRNTALELQNEARKEDRKAYLILELKPGNSSRYDAQELADFLVSPELSGVTPVIWVPKSVSGYNVLVALAGRQIIMNPKASLGDIGRGKAIKAELHAPILAMAKKGRNQKMSPALVKGMLDPAVQVKIVTVEKKGGIKEQKVVTEAEGKALLKQRLKITGEVTVKEAGAKGTFTGTQARSQGILVSHLAEFRSEVADYLGVKKESMREKGDDAVPKATIIRIDDVIEPGLEAFLKRQINRAVARGVNLIVFEIDSPGGYVSTTVSLAKTIMELEDRKVRTVAYIPERAYSGAAILSLSCDEIYIAPEAHIGDAGMIEVGPGGQFQFAPQKILSPFLQNVETIAKANHRPVALAKAMVQKDLLVYKVTHKKDGRVWYMTQTEIDVSTGEWIQGTLVPESDKDLLLTMVGARAVETKLADAVVHDVGELKMWLNIPAETNLAVSKRTWVDNLVFTLSSPWATGMLFFMAILLIYLELHFMVGIFGIGSVLCFALFFWSRFLGGTAGWLEVTLFFVGLLCILMEIFVIPGIGVFGISGGLLIMASLVLASHSLAELDTGHLVEKVAPSFGVLVASIVGVALTATFVGKYLPHIPLLGNMILVPPSSRAATHHEDDPLIHPNLKIQMTGEGLASRIGEQGVTLSALRPSGKAKFGDDYLNVMSEGNFIDEDVLVEVFDIRNNQLIVRKITS